MRLTGTIRALMVTKRARLWLQRGVMAAIILVVIMLGASSWLTSEAIEDDLLFVSGDEPVADPADIGIPFVAVDVPGPLGNYPAWWIDGTEDTWALFVHDLDTGREQALSLLPTFVEQGLPVLVISYRNDFGAPPSDGGHHRLGADEWEDVEAAVTFALDAGAADVVIVGYGSGGSAALTFLRQSLSAERVVGVVLDSPFLDPGAAVDDRTAADNVPGFLSGWGKAMATFRFGVEWAVLDQVVAAEEFSTPILLIHGDLDDRAPVRSADAFAAARPYLVEYLRWEGIGHGEAFASDPDRYIAAVGRFLRRVTAEPASGDGEGGHSGLARS